MPALLVLLVASAVLYLWSLSSSGYANTFYAAAVQAGTKSVEAWFFGSLDSSNFITVDKPPASLWVMVLSARAFGFSSWSLLAPQAVMGVGSVALVFATVRRGLVGAGSTLANIGGLVAGVVLAATPAAALMFRFDNPDALLVLLMTAAGYAVIRALPRASWQWLALAGVALGFAFLTKMLQGLLVLPAFGIVYLLAAQTSVLKRLLHLLIAAVALVVAAGWWVVAVALWPADARPYIGGSTNNSVLDLVFGYNGLGRVFGGAGNGGGGSGTSGSSFGGATGLQRLFSSEMGLEISWLLPAALLLLVLGLVITLRAKRTDGQRAGLLLWGGWLAVSGLMFSFMSGTIHPYYTVALAPAIAGLIGTGGVLLWAHRQSWIARIGLTAAIAISAVWGFFLLSENADWLPWLRWVLLIGSLAAAAGALVLFAIRRHGTVLLAGFVLTGTLFGIGGSAAYAIATASVAHSGSIPTVGSVSNSAMGGGPGGGGTAGGGGAGGGAPTGNGAGTGSAPTGTAPTGTASTGTAGAAAGTGTGGAASSQSQGGPVGSALGGARPSGARPSGTRPSGVRPSGTNARGGTGGVPSGTKPSGTTSSGSAQTITGSEPSSSPKSSAAPTDAAGGPGGGNGGAASSAALTKLLKAAGTTWSAATDGSQSAATLELSSGTAVMAIGGWSSDPAPTLAQFEAYVHAGKVHYYIAGNQGGGGGTGGSGVDNQTAIATWVKAHYTAKTVGGSTIYDLTKSK